MWSRAKSASKVVWGQNPHSGPCGGGVWPSPGRCCRLSLCFGDLVSQGGQSPAERLETVAGSSWTAAAGYVLWWTGSADNDPLPELTLIPVFKYDGPLLLLNIAVLYLSTLVGKTGYYLMVKLLNQFKMKGSVDTPWGAHLTLTKAQRPEWRAVYKPMLTKRVGDLQWRVLHAAVSWWLSLLSPERESVSLFLGVWSPVSSLSLSVSCLFCLMRFSHIILSFWVTGIPRRKKWNVNSLIFS